MNPIEVSISRLSKTSVIITESESCSKMKAQICSTVFAIFTWFPFTKQKTRSLNGLFVSFNYLSILSEHFCKKIWFIRFRLFGRSCWRCISDLQTWNSLMLFQLMQGVTYSPPIPFAYCIWEYFFATQKSEFPTRITADSIYMFKHPNRRHWYPQWKGRSQYLSPAGFHQLNKVLNFAACEFQTRNCLDRHDYSRYSKLPRNGILLWWGRRDSNPLSRKATDLQSAATRHRRRFPMFGVDKWIWTTDPSVISRVL